MFYAGGTIDIYWALEQHRLSKTISFLDFNLCLEVSQMFLLRKIQSLHSKDLNMSSNISIFSKSKWSTINL